MNKDITNLIREINAKGNLKRTGTIEAARAEDGNTVEGVYELSFSSEVEVERWFGMEVLGHKPAEVRMDWLKSSSAPLLLQHDTDKQIGVVESAKLAERRGTARVRFGKSALAREIEADVAAGIRKNVSVGYRVHNMILTQQEKDGESASYRVTDWEPYEISIVSVPADRSVGTDRSQENPKSQSEENVNKHPLRQFHNPPEGGSGSTAAPVASTIDLNAERQKWQQEQATRLKDIESIGAQFRHLVPNIDAMARAAVAEGHDTNRFRADLLNAIRERKQTDLPQGGNDGLTRGEQRDLGSYSWIKALREFKDGKLTGVEAEMHQHGERGMKQRGAAVSGLVIPLEVLNFRANVTTSGAAIPTNVSPDFVSALRARLPLVTGGARLITGLVGTLSFPKVTTGSSAAWLAENGSSSDGTMVIGSGSFTPKRLGYYLPVSNQLLMQQAQADVIIRDDIAKAIAYKVQDGAINGTGSSNQPTGILATSGIGAVVMGTNGLAPTWASVVGLETEVAADNADVGSLHYLINAQTRGKLKTTAKVASTDSVMIMGDRPELNGYNCFTTNLVPNNLDKGSSTGVCSAGIFGDLSELVMGQWDGIMINLDDKSSLGSNITNFHVNSYWDIVVRRAASFAAVKDWLSA